jgi:uncharacterized repeat protein (TIGR01451 family)
MKLMKWGPLCCVGFMLLSLRLVLAQPTAAPVPVIDSQTVTTTVVTSPMNFEPNEGQTDNRVKFLSRGAGYMLFLTGDGAVLALENAGRHPAIRPVIPAAQQPLPSPVTMQERARTVKLNPPATAYSEAVLSLHVLGANQTAQVTGLDLSETRSNYFLGNDPSKWHTDVPTYGRVRYAGVYPGIDLVYYGNQQNLEYDFVIAPGANPKAIGLGFGSGHNGRGPVALRVDDQGDMVALLENGEVRFHKPVAYQLTSGGRRTPVESHYALTSDDRVQFELGDYDRSRSLVIDPVLTFGTYLGGSDEDSGTGITIGLLFGSIIASGNTRSSDFPLASPLEQWHPGTCGSQPCRDVYVSKFNPKGTAVQYSTYIGGSGDDVATSVTQDSLGDMFVVGHTLSTDFPVTNKAFQKTFHGGSVTGDAFVFELASKGAYFQYSTYLGGSGDDEAFSIVLDAAFDAYVVGYTASADFPTTAGAFQANCPLAQGGGCSTGFVTELNPGGTAPVYSTYLGGSNGLGEAAYGIALDSQNNAYIAGITGSPNFPTTAHGFDRICGTDKRCNGSYDGFVVKMNPTGSGLLYSTFLGGSGYDYASGIAIDSHDAIYVSGNTVSSDFPTTASAGQKTYGGASASCDPLSGAVCGDATVTKFAANGSLVYSTYLGGSGDEYPGISMVVDSLGDAYVTGQTSSTNFPVVNAFQSAFGGGATDAFLTRVNPNGSFSYSSYLGGNGDDSGYRTTLDASGAVYMTGATTSTNFPVTAGAYQRKCGTDGNCNGGLSDAWVARVALSADLSLTNSGPGTVNSGGTITYTIMVKNQGPDTALSLSMTDATPTGTNFASVTASGGSCTTPPVGGTGTVTCVLASQPKGATLTVSLVLNVTAQPGATIKDVATVTSGSSDPNAANNSATVSTTVN